MSDERVDLGQIFLIILRQRKVVLTAVILAVGITVVISLLLPRWYKARATILPPESTTGQTDIVGIMRFAGYQPAMLPTVTSPSEIYVAILESRRVMDAVIDSMDLMDTYGHSHVGKTVKRVGKHLDVKALPEGVVRVEYEDKDRQRSADVTNAFVRELDRFNRETKVTTARRVRKFIETRIGESEGDLEQAEGELKAFKEHTGAVLISEQTKASIETAAELYGKIAELEVSMERMGQFATDRSPEVLDLKSQIRALERKLAEMGYIRSNASENTDSRLFPRFDDAPQLEKQLGELLRDVEIKRSVFKVLSEQYEEAKIQEMRDTPTLQVLDWGHPPLVRSKPRRKIMVVISGVAAFLLASCAVLWRERTRGAVPPAGSPVASETWATLRGDARELSSRARRGFRKS